MFCPVVLKEREDFILDLFLTLLKITSGGRVDVVPSFKDIGCCFNSNSSLEMKEIKVFIY